MTMSFVAMSGAAPLVATPLVAAPHAMGAGAATLITIGVVAAALIGLEIWGARRAKKRAAEAAAARAAQGPGAPVDSPREDADRREGSYVGAIFGGLALGFGWLWTKAFGSPHDQPDPTLDMDPDELAEYREEHGLAGDRDAPPFS